MSRQLDRLDTPSRKTSSGLVRAAVSSPEKRRLGAAAFDAIVTLASKMSHKHPGSDPALYGVRVMRDVRYGDPSVPEHTLDIYMPDAPPPGPMPVVLYVHGGGFRLLSKETHWMMAVAFARRGYLVLNIDYRLAPEHPFPAALQDVNRAWLWLLDHAERLGGDLGRIVVAGESAGANLVTSLAIETSYLRPEPWAREVFDRGVQPSAVMAACGIYQVSGVERLMDQVPVPRLVGDWLLEMRDGYLGGTYHETTSDIELADPLTILERGQRPVRPLPPFFLPVGGADVLVDDTLRLARALDALGVPQAHEIYDGEPHAFHMLTWRAASKRLWKDTFHFLATHLPQTRRGAASVAPLAPRRKRSWLEQRIISAMAA